MCLYLNKTKLDHTNSKYVGELYMPHYKIFPCGRCHECVSASISSLTVRWREQLKESQADSTYFITLTYDDDNLPTNEEGQSVLNYKDVVDFLKRLRRKQDYELDKQGISKEEKTAIMDNLKVQYVGEYGTQGTLRPHYHLVITNLVLPIENIESLKDNTIAEIWKKGHVDVKQADTNGTVKYLMKYTYKDKYLTSPTLTSSTVGVPNVAVTPLRYTFKLLDRFEYLLTLFGYSREHYRHAFHDTLYLEMQEELNDENSILKKTDYQKYTQEDIENLSLYWTSYRNRERGDKTRYYLKGKNKGRIIQKVTMSNGIGMNYLTLDVINKHLQSLDTTYRDIDVVNGKVKTIVKKLPKYYIQKIFNPVISGEEKEQFYTDYSKEHSCSRLFAIEEFSKRSVRRYREDMPNYRDSQYFKIRMKSFKEFVDRSEELTQYVETGREEHLEKFIYDSIHSDAAIIKRASYESKTREMFEKYEYRVKTNGLGDVL